MASKRKRSVMSLEKKLDIITQIRQGRSQRAVADGFGVAKSTVGDIWKNREKIEIHVSASTNPAFAKKRCIVRDAHFHKLDEACYIWFQQQRAKGAPVSGPLLQEKALQLFPSLYPDEDESAFKASSGWLHKFCRRHGVRELSLQGEALSADTSAVEPFCQQLKNKIEDEGYSRCQIFNADETGLWWRLMPSKSLVDSGEKQARNFKKPKDRVTVLGCANASGTCKVPLAFIHKSAKPCCFKHMDMSLLPVSYFSQSKSWMNGAIFGEWFHKKFVPFVKHFCQVNNIEYKILLLLDNAPAHPSTETLTSADGRVTSCFLPPNSTSILQPMDQGILEAFKRRYKKQLLRHIILENGTSTLTVPEIVKKLTIKDAVYWSAQAWEEVTSLSLSRAWNKLIPPDPLTPDESNEDAGAEIEGMFQQLGSEEGNSWQSPSEWMSEDSGDPGYQLLTDNEIVAQVSGEADLSASESEDEQDPGPTVSHAQAHEAFGIALQWLEAKGTDPAHLLLVQNWMTVAGRKRNDSLTQTEITSFFRPHTSSM